MKKKIKTQLGLIIAIVVIYTVIEIYGVTALHFRYVKIDRETSDTLNSISEIQNLVNEIDNDVLKFLVKNEAAKNAAKNDIEKKIDQCKSVMNEYDGLTKSDEENVEFVKFSGYYKNYTEGVKDVLNSNDMENGAGLYKKIENYKNQLSDSGEKLYSISDHNHVSKMQSAALQRDITANGTTILSVIFLIILIRMDRKRIRTEKELIQTEEKVVKQKEKISTAVLKDVLTETENRMSFINRFSGGKAMINEGYANYFIMFDIDDFSSVNSTYGVKSGDLILNSTAAKIMDVFSGSPVYRTGSDEFVAVVSTTSEEKGYNRVTGLIEKAREALNTANKIKSGTLVVSYSISVVKKTGPCTVDETILGSLKESLKQGRITQPGAVMYTEIN